MAIKKQRKDDGPLKITLKAARVNAGLSREAVAKEIGVAVSTIKNWETDVTSPRIFKLNKLCDIYGIKLENLRL